MDTNLNNAMRHWLLFPSAKVTFHFKRYSDVERCLWVPLIGTHKTRIGQTDLGTISSLVPSSHPD